MLTGQTNELQAGHHRHRVIDQRDGDLAGRERGQRLGTAAGLPDRIAGLSRENGRDLANVRVIVDYQDDAAVTQCIRQPLLRYGGTVGYG